MQSTTIWAIVMIVLMQNKKGPRVIFGHFSPTRSFNFQYKECLSHRSKMRPKRREKVEKR
jgi:hypothetical protein